jgi:hypothetical protein
MTGEAIGLCGLYVTRFILAAISKTEPPPNS